MSSPSPHRNPLDSARYSFARQYSTYRRMDYHHGDAVRITESRRRSPVISSTKSVQSARTLAPSSMDEQPKSSSRSHGILTQPSRPRSSSTTQQHHDDHVTSRSTLKPKAQVVIVQRSVAVSVDFKKRGTPPHFSIDVATPPPTPRMGRLSTPELDDPDERPFCDCCTGIQGPKYCAGCGCELSSRRN
ncbi:hypothetical protein BU23DRAFT_574176 [Bimuria novae-zelandiae CBS 107.79]|uniref:Uncharacterized protein n=1 Tax=Bimuria novae-zelandiae CBS 107.79 TaxID=1447943 RepID=A0A6A5UQK1_9PLEO|nr:hypothetical protein BU23DRAFT_574176 [Bimuria novae-zelandiae CBS 107.79]